ncbi:MAG TPA: ABC transporter permease [Gemmataceae bacterium]|nr:ABC transporter permease [Gemmataceae bacterium]
MILATLVVEKSPLQWADVPAGIATWITVVGGFATFFLALWLLCYALGLGSLIPAQKRLASIFTVAFLIALLGFACGWGLTSVSRAPDAQSSDAQAHSGGALLHTIGNACYLIGGATALAAFFFPFLVDLVQMRWRRVWALARLSFKEAIRRRVLWVFSAMILVFLFASWFLPYKPEDQVRNYVRVVYWVMEPLLLTTACLVAAFSIPTDVRSQTIHTIVTKPVERFEIVLGRFLGYALLMSLVLVVMTGVSLLYVFREIDPDAKEESMRARIPLYGNLTFRGKEGNYQGDSVGREWDYRRYIAGGKNSPQRAIWSYNDLPSELANRPEGKVPCEFSFDIFRTVKDKEGQEGKGVHCSFTFQTWHWDPKNEADYTRARNLPSADPNKLAEQYGIYEIFYKKIEDYHTQSVEVPTALFKNALNREPARPTTPGAEAPPELQVVVKFESGGQYLGVAKHDFYILDAEGTFAWNFFKGALGLWLRLLLVIGVAVTCSTYLSGVISFVATAFIYFAGLFRDTDYIKGLAEGTTVGGGPMESLIRLVRHESLVTPLESTAGTDFAHGTDWLYRRLLQAILHIFPDVDRLDWTSHVAEGFNIAMSSTVLLSTLMLLAYLLPWAILGYYLMKSREIATW